MVVPDGRDDVRDDYIQNRLYKFDSERVANKSFYMDFGEDGILAYGKLYVSFCNVNGILFYCVNEKKKKKLSIGQAPFVLISFFYASK